MRRLLLPVGLLIASLGHAADLGDIQGESLIVSKTQTPYNLPFAMVGQTPLEAMAGGQFTAQWLSGVSVLFGASHDGAIGVGGAAYQTGANGINYPAGVLAYGKLNDPGHANYATGINAVVDAMTTGTVNNELDSNSFFADSPNTFPPDYSDVTKSYVEGLTVACGGPYKCYFGIGIAPNAFRGNQYAAGIYFWPNVATTYDILTDAGTTGGPAYSAYLKNSGQGANINLILQTTGTPISSNPVFATLDSVGAPHFILEQDGSSWSTGAISVGASAVNMGAGTVNSVNGYYLNGTALSAGNLNYTPSGAGAVTTSLATWLGKYFSVAGYATPAQAFSAAGSAAVNIPWGFYSFATPITLANTQQISGEAGGLSTFTYTGSSGAALQLVGSGAAIKDIFMSTNVPASTATAIQLGNGEQGQGQTLRDTTIVGTWATGIIGNTDILRQLYNVNVESSGATGILWQNTVNPDSGDDNWNGVTVSGPTTDLVKYVSGGGLKVSGFKGLGGVNGFHLVVPNGVTSQDFLFTGSSIENSSANCMLLETSGATGVFGNSVIVGNEFAGCPNGITLNNGGAFGGVIAGNAFSSISNSSIVINDWAASWTIGRNTYNQKYPIDNRDNFQIYEAGIDWHQVRPVNSSNTTPVPIFHIVFHNSGSAVYESAHVRLFVQGLASNAGAVGCYTDFLLFNNNGIITSQNITALTCGAASISFSLNLSTPFQAALQIAKNSGTSFAGTATLDIDGGIKTLTFN